MEGRIYAPKPVRISLSAILSQSGVAQMKSDKRSKDTDETTLANAELLQILG
jgi:hypothetical protein